MAEEKSHKKTLIGSVMSSGKMDKTIVVSIERLTKHPFYGKYIKKRVKYPAHDDQNQCGVGDKVSIIESRPLSKTKRWRVKEILEKAK
ncbi:MAG: 30S ribosomal protein S17 [Deltaproteobacteria bacterium RBG_19FT_COMBO_58_16]|nr:MAG: 30S ribosomal protein S17 [Deltaproteobacteria bacterium RBG_19FT_COMBO_58_16]